MACVGRTSGKRRKGPDFETPEITALRLAMDAAYEGFHDAEDTSGVGSRPTVEAWESVSGTVRLWWLVRHSSFRTLPTNLRCSI